MMQAGDLISGKYRLLRQLGRGGMGSVWAARNELTDRDFAVKFLLPELARNRDALHRFFLEARACGQIKHPAVVAVYDMGQAEDGTPYLVMELMEGEGFDQRLARSGVLRPGEACAAVAYIARGLEEAHVRGLVHRDLKPGNIFFGIDDRGEIVPRILDFGVSKATAAADPKFVRTNTGAVLGSPAYMSPEQARGDEAIDARSDVWSLGVILYEALTGRPPFEGANYNQLMVNIITTAHQPAIAVNPALPQELSELIDRTLTKNPNDRIRTARELADILEGIAARVTGTPYPGMPVRPRTSIAPSPTPTETWVDVKSGRKDSNALVWASGAIFAVAVVGIGAIAIARSAPPVVDVAARSTAVFLHARERLAATLAGMPVPQPESPPTATPAPTGEAIELSPETTAVPTSAPTSAPSARASSSALPTTRSPSTATPSTSTTTPKKKKGGGVTKPGF
jgi:eukaryotic-like serine/threonine-protein kinase